MIEPEENQTTEMNNTLKIPKRVFIVPYRNRIQHKFFFCKYMSFILEDADDYEIFFSHQCDARTFNRGAVKNIGFIAIKNKYPNHYKDITFIFNDVDTIPFTKIFDYQTSRGTVKHYYGYKHSLGGIVVIKGSDFERTNGFPCFWGWGMEDNVLQKRCEHIGLNIDRSVFYNIGSPEILQLFDGISRIISKKDPWRGEHDNGKDGLFTIKQLQYTIDNKSDNPTDNIFVVNNSNIHFINIKTFLTHIPFGSEEYYNYDLREPKRKIVNPDKIKETKKSVVTTQDWTNIPYYPTTRERRENVAKYLSNMGRAIPPELLNQIKEDKKNEIIEDTYNNFQTTNSTLNQPSQSSQPIITKNILVKHPHHNHKIINHHINHNNYIYNSKNQQQNSNSSTVPPNKYSPHYAAYIGSKPRAQTSANIRLGGAYYTDRKEK